MPPDLVEGGKDEPAFYVVTPSLVDFGFSPANPKDWIIRPSVVQGGDLGYLIERFIACQYGPSHYKAIHTNKRRAGLANCRISPGAPRRSPSIAPFQRRASRPSLHRIISQGRERVLPPAIHEIRDDGVQPDRQSHRRRGAYLGQYLLFLAPLIQDLVLLPKLWNHTLGPIVFESAHGKGRHVAAWGSPDAIVVDLRTMFKRGGSALACAGGRSGYRGEELLKGREL
ncbi:hypothetical protein BJ170DRAFT_594169 [Xylariales sp. AK1849]|nr:hypothetical protein BJ170DRAFT_594169 [Xylariales sp. AK1849]